MPAAEHWAAMIRARAAQRTELATPISESRWAAYAPSYRFDPRRAPEPSLAAALDLIEPDDEIVEVGGGAGRIGLPMALAAKSLVNVEPSAAMRRQFAACAAEHGIVNARALDAAWPANVTGDLIVSADVIYFVEEIAAFVSALHERARRRVAVLTWTVPPPNVNAALFRIACDAEEAPVPGADELLPVLDELGIAAEARHFDEPFTWPETLPTDEESAVRFALAEIEPQDEDAARRRVQARLGELFDHSGEQWLPSWRTPSTAMMLTWTTG